MANGSSGKSSSRLPQTPDLEPVSRRAAIQKAGGWVIYLGALGSIAACAGGGEEVEPTPTPTTTPTPTPSPTPFCNDCSTVTGSATGLNRTDLPANSVAYNAGLELFVCRDASGFYAMTAICPHASTNIATGPDANGCSEHFRTNDLSFGFCCGGHGSRFDANGLRVSGAAVPGSQLVHYRMSIDGAGDLFVDKTPPFVDPSCRCA